MPASAKALSIGTRAEPQMVAWSPEMDRRGPEANAEAVMSAPP
jgi:hypothetical protein